MGALLAFIAVVALMMIGVPVDFSFAAMTLIPPSNTMILYAVVTREPLAACFLATIGPGILLMIFLSALNKIHVKRYLGGIFTPTEAAAIRVVYAIPVGFFVYKELDLKKIGDAVVSAATTTGVIMVMDDVSVIAIISPPMAPILFMACRVGNVGMSDVIKPAFYFMACAALPVMLVTTYYSPLSLFLRRLMGFME